METGLPRVRRANQAHLRGPFGPNGVKRGGVAPALLGTSELVGQLLDTRFEARLKVLRPLVLGDCAQHLFQAHQALVEVTGLSERLLGLFVLGGNVGRHSSRQNCFLSSVTRRWIQKTWPP